MRNLRTLCCMAALAACVSPAWSAPRIDLIVVTLDGHHYVSNAAPLVLSPVERLVLAPETLMANCRRSNGEPLAPGAFRLVYAIDGASVDAITMRLAFGPTRVILETPFKDVVCDGEAKGGETGIDRLFRDDFEQA